MTSWRMQPDDLTPAWFSAVLEAEISAVTCTPIGVGMVGLNLRCVLVGNGLHATSVVVKLPSADPTSRATGVALRNYEREVKFYKEIGPTVGIRAPRCYHGSWDAESGDFVLVLEDAAPAQPGDQIAGCTLPQAQAALIELAHLHAPRWGDPRLSDVDWLTRRDEASVELITNFYRHFWPEFLQRYGDSLSPTQRVIGAQLGEALPTWLMRSTLPPTVTHGDYRLDNLLFASEHGGDAVIAVDWQTPGHGEGIADAAYFLGAGLLPEQRRLHERDLLRRYHQELLEGGVQLSFDECWHAYRFGAFAGVAMSVIAPMLVERTERGDAMFTAMATRHLQHAEDLDSLALLRS
jgi:Phosphotransferase enzyme family